jgi:hypothetical protein
LRRRADCLDQGFFRARIGIAQRQSGGPFPHVPSQMVVRLAHRSGMPTALGQIQRAAVEGQTQSNGSARLACTSRIASPRATRDEGSPIAAHRLRDFRPMVTWLRTARRSAAQKVAHPVAARRSAALREQPQATNFFSGIRDCPDTSRFLMAERPISSSLLVAGSRWP